MELHQIKYFLAVVRYRHFTRAARHCQVAQPSLSQQIKKLERELGQPLFDRAGKKVLMTDAGNRFLEKANAVLAAIEDARKVVAADDGALGTLNIGAIPTIAPYVLPPLIKSFNRLRPGAQVQIMEDITEHLVRACLDGEIDAAILALPIDAPLLESEAIFTEPLLLAMPKNHALARRKNINIADLQDQPFVLLDPVHCLGSQVLNFCRDKHCLPLVRCRSSQLLTVQEMVGLGMGISLIPQMAARADDGRKCCYRDLSAPAPARIIGICRHRRRFESRLLKDFLNLARRPSGTMPD